MRNALKVGRAPHAIEVGISCLADTLLSEVSLKRVYWFINVLRVFIYRLVVQTPQ